MLLFLGSFHHSFWSTWLHQSENNRFPPTNGSRTDKVSKVIDERYLITRLMSRIVHRSFQVESRFNIRCFPMCLVVVVLGEVIGVGLHEGVGCSSMGIALYVERGSMKMRLFFTSCSCRFHRRLCLVEAWNHSMNYRYSVRGFPFLHPHAALV